MGRKRMFTQEVYEALSEGISSHPVKDFFDDIPAELSAPFHGPELEENMSNLQDYLQDISDLNDYTEEKLEEIFCEVEQIDKRYAGIFQEQANTLESYERIVKNLTREISDKDFIVNFDKNAFLSSVSRESNILFQVKWENILQKPTDEITQEEYIQLAELLVRMGDMELLEDMLNMCYEYADVDFNQAGGLSVTAVSYKADKKLQELMKAVNTVMLITEAGCMAGVGTEDNRTREHAIRINQLLQTFFPLGETLDIATTENLRGDRKVTSERLIEISYNSNGELELKFFRYPGKNGVWIEQKPTIITVSPAVTGESGERLAYDESFQYMSGYIGNDTSLKAMSKETINQVLSSLWGKIPGSSMVSTVQSIITSGINAAKNPSEMCKEIADVGILSDQFQLTYVSSDVDGKGSSHSFALYPSETTMNWVEAFNKYMQHGSGEKHARACGYSNLPGGKLTVEYLMKYPNKVSKMLKKLDFKLKNNLQTGDYKEEIIEIYQGVKE